MFLFFSLKTAKFIDTKHFLFILFLQENIFFSIFFFESKCNSILDTFKVYFIMERRSCIINDINFEGR